MISYLLDIWTNFVHVVLPIIGLMNTHHVTNPCLLIALAAITARSYLIFFLTLPFLFTTFSPVTVPSVKNSVLTSDNIIVLYPLFLSLRMKSTLTKVVTLRWALWLDLSCNENSWRG
jgi:hypothetical protein